MTNKIERIADRIFILICDMAELGEDYSLLQREYNSLIDEYKLDRKKVKWVNPEKFELI